MILIHTHKYNVMDRLIALNILLKYKQEGSYLNLTLNSCFQHHDLSRESKNLITQLVYGTVQYQIYLEYMLIPFLHGRVKTFEKMLLLMSLYQHMFLNQIPDYAIVNEAVNIAKKKKGKRTAQFINAVLKNAFSNPPSLDDLDEVERISIETSHPLWMVKMFIKQYGLIETKKICQVNNEVPLRSARVNTLKTTRQKVCLSDGFTASPYHQDCVYFQQGNIAHTSLYHEGLITIQDESSQFVARLLNPQANDYVLDMCCAPGSKTSHLAALMNNQGRIDGYDLYEHKIELVKKQMKRLGVNNVYPRVYDSTQLFRLYPPQTFDKILLDGPCSGLGVIARKPEIKYHDSSIMDEIIHTQEKLLENAYVLLKNSGNIVYSTCTINKKENEKQIQAFIKRHPDMQIIEEKTILPYQYHSDGFYMCLLVKGALS